MLCDQVALNHFNKSVTASLQPLQEEEVLKRQKELEEEKHGLQSRKEEYQKDLERLRDAQRKLERDREAVQRQLDKMEELHLSEVRDAALRSMTLREARWRPEPASSRK